MPIATAKSTAPIIKPGVKAAVCYSIVDLGTQFNAAFNNHSRKVQITWELPHERMDFEDDKTKQKVSKPRAISKEYTLSLGKKAKLLADLTSWRGKPFTPEELSAFDVAKLAGANCQLNIIHQVGKSTGATYANISGIFPMAAGATRYKPENPVLIFDLPKSGPITFPPNMPEWIQNKIKTSEEYRLSLNPMEARQDTPTRPMPTDAEMANLSPAGPEDMDDVPF